MTEEQKEYEAMKLVNMFDKLSRQRVIQPMSVTPEGNLTTLDLASIEDAVQPTDEDGASHDSDLALD
ncbi:UNVERIFIED_CONTAM: Synembryn-A [Gekko kuhli]